MHMNETTEGSLLPHVCPIPANQKSLDVWFLLDKKMNILLEHPGRHLE